MDTPPAIVPFQLSVNSRGPNRFVVRAFAAGRSAEAPLVLPDLRLSPTLLGPALGQALFPAPIRRLLMDVARGADEAGARIQIQLYAAPDLAAIPWEWVSLGQNRRWRPAVRDDYAFVRAGGQRTPPPPTEVSGPLRMLIACAPGVEAGIAPMGHALLEVVRSGHMVIDLLRDANPLSLHKALAEAPFHIVHVIASDAWGEGNGARLRIGRNLDGATLTGILADCPTLRLLTLAADADAEPAALGAAAFAVHEHLRIAAIALGGLDHAQAAHFGSVCYGAIATGNPVDLAVTDGRAALEANGGLWGAPRLWITPGAERPFIFAPTDSRPPAVSRLPVGTPLRPIRVTVSRAAQALANVRAVVVDATTVGKPVRRVPPDHRRFRVQPRLIALIVALIILVALVSQALPSKAAESLGNEYLQHVPPIPYPAISLLQPDPASVPEPRTYQAIIISEGDTLSSLAERTGSDPNAIAALNRLSPAEPLRPGRPLVIPVYRDGEILPAAPIVKRGNPERPFVALTFDIEINDTNLYRILDVMDKYDVKGTFFVTGSWVKCFPAAAKAIVERGHEIANHSLTHPWFSKISSNAAIRELNETERLVREITGVSTRPYFRFPFGDSTPQMVKVIEQAGFVAFHWSSDDRGMPAWLNRIAADPTQGYGGIILMHGRTNSATELDRHLERLFASGLQPTTLSNVLR